MDLTTSAPSSSGTATISPATDRTIEQQALAPLLDQLRQRFPTDEIVDIQRAFVVARNAHADQLRSSGEPYITHPVAVAQIVIDMGLDHRSVMAALLHDVLEDTPVDRAELQAQFGEEIAALVDGLSKLTNLEDHTKEEAQAESFRKMLLAMTSDIRVILIKLADRLHNMRTIGSLRRDKQKRIGRETLDVYAPIATRLGMFKIKSELEDLGFKACFPMRSRILQRTVEQARRNRESVVERIQERIAAALGEAGIEATVIGREKHLYSLYRKMTSKQLSFEQVFDMFALRVVVDNDEDCYRALGLVHRLYKPISRRFKDYIAIPKANSYQSLHSVVRHSDGLPVEVQIRTREMDRFAESGIAAHWAYKSGLAASQTTTGGNSSGEASNQMQARTHFWLNDLIDLQHKTTDSVDFVENVKVDLFPSEIYVFTPKGRIVQLPKQSTAVDFAYAVHSEVGNTCVAARVDRILTPLSTALESGQTVEVLTSDGATPSPLWLNFVITAKARTAIRHYLRNLDRSQAAAFGERLLKRALFRHEHTLESIPEKLMQCLLSEFGFGSVEELFVGVGLGHHLPSQMAERLVRKQLGDETGAAELPVKDIAPVMIEGREGSVVTLARCCRPIPGDKVLGYFNPGAGVSVHRSICPQVQRYRRRTRERVPVEWALNVHDQFEAEISVHLVDQPGALARVTSTLSMMNVNIDNMDFTNKGENNVQIGFVLSVEDRQHLARIIRRLRNLSVVRHVKRD